MKIEKTVEKATFPGPCRICGHTIYVDDMIARYEICNNPVAAHLECEAKIQDMEGK